jgi:hypothetical protein
MSSAALWLECADGEVLLLPLAAGGAGREANGLVLMSSAGEHVGFDFDGDDGDSTRAACWLMPSLPPQLIADVLGW